MTERCAYCRHPNHHGITPARITPERAAELWLARGPQHSIAPTAAECETIMIVWERMPGGDTCYADAFTQIHMGQIDLWRVLWDDWHEQANAPVVIGCHAN